MFKHINSQTQATGVALALEMAAKASLDNTRKRDPYSRFTSHKGKGRGIQSTVRGPLVRSSHITAKTHKTLPCLATRGAAASLPAHVARLQMLKDRHENA